MRHGERMTRGRPFKPGQSGNPGGRPKGIAAAARQHTDRCIAVLAEALESPDARTRIAAAHELLDRGYGKAIAATASVSNPLGDLDDETLEAAIAAVKDALAH